jgi:predicted ATP-grasp superfamily ATP-dependent carboligase
MPRRALVTDGEERSVVGTVRALAAAGWQVGVVASRRPAAAHWSRACAERLRLVDPREDPAAFVAELAAAAGAGGYDVLLPGSDAALLAISMHREQLDGGVRHGLPRHEVVLACLDKGRLAEAATIAGLATPRSVACDDLPSARAAAAAFGLPVVVKPVRSLVMRHGVMHAQGGQRADDATALEALVEACGTPCLVQALEQGPIVSCSGVMVDGRLRAVAASRYERTWPPAGGNAAFARTIPPPSALPEQVERLLTELGWEGIFELELIERPDGGLVAIDLNPRVFGSISLVVAAGAALPAVWCAALMGEPAPQAVARPGVRYRWEDGDLRHALWQLRHGDARAALAAAAPHRKVVHAHLRAGDPLPLIARGVSLAGARLRRPRPFSEPPTQV